VVVPSGPWTVIQAQQQVSAWWAWNTRLAARRLVVLYDLIGTGLSSVSDDGPHFGLDQQVDDLKAVVSSLALPPVTLFAAQHAGPAAIKFAALQPDMVTHLVLWGTYARGADYFDETRSQAIHAVMPRDWDLFTETMAHAQLG
jgi:pimeloyl-ACP methyl ester carboxylesterase